MKGFQKQVWAWLQHAREVSLESSGNSKQGKAQTALGLQLDFIGCKGIFERTGTGQKTNPFHPWH
jgi:hypothetical protein